MPIYLAKIARGTADRYELRQSYACGEHCFAHRTLFDLGPTPNDFFEPFDDKTILFNQNLVSAVNQASGGDGELLLESLLRPFFPKEIRRRLALFPPRISSQHGPLRETEREEMHHQIHIFDRRRLYYLRYGAVDQSRLARLHEKCCRPLLGQSRDEREYYFAAEEQALEPGMYYQYLFASLGLARYFQEGFAQWFPEALARDEVDGHFVDELCRLSSDRTFFLGHEETSLHPHLYRYLVMFFDHRPSQRSFAHDFAEAFITARRRFRWPQRPKTPPQEISAIFATPYQELERMSRLELSRLYRQQAMRLHPDRGGDHDAFIALTKAFQELHRSKKK